MKKSFTTLGCPDWSFEKILDEAARMGFSGIEVRGIEGEMLAQNMPAFMPGAQQDTLRRLAAKGLTITNFGTSCSFHDASKLQNAIEEGRAAIDVCARMGIPAIRVFGNNLPADEPTEAVYDRIAGGIREICLYAEGTNVEVWLEVHGDINTPERINAIADRVNHPKFGILWDIANSHYENDYDFMPFYKGIKPLLKHTHIKDQRGADNRLCRVGQGDVPILPIVRTLLSDGYDGYFSLEWEKKWHLELPSAEIAYPDFIELLKKA